MASANASEAQPVYGPKHAVVPNAERIVVHVRALECVEHSRVMDVRGAKGLKLSSLLRRS